MFDKLQFVADRQRGQVRGKRQTKVLSDILLGTSEALKESYPLLLTFCP